MRPDPSNGIDSCLNYHMIEQFGGRRGPNLTVVGDRLIRDQMILRIANGGVNMPAYAPSLTLGEMNDIIALMESRSSQTRQTKQ